MRAAVRWSLLAVVVLVAASFAVWVWPTRWVYFGGDGITYRRDRFTGAVYAMPLRGASAGRWSKLEPSDGRSRGGLGVDSVLGR